jgi:allantoate deiminase
MANLCPMAMLFVRCLKGISHTPEEFAEEADMQAAVDSLVNFIKLLK